MPKNILIGITGGIAAYKAAYLVRLFVKKGYNVKVIMTPFAKKFISPLTLSTLSKNPVYSEFHDKKTGIWHSHVDLGRWADAFVIAPATANTIAKMSNGIADNFLLTTYLSVRCPVFIAPAMDLDMFKHPATQKNIQTLKKHSNIIIEPETGELASGLEGKGRLAAPEHIYNIVTKYLFNNQDFINKTILITAGPTYEHFDPVRFIGNHSSGKMGFAIAEEMAKRSAKVILITGPVKISTSHPNIKQINVTSAQQMFEKAMEFFPKCDIAILSAAVADYTPVKTSQEKIKKHGDKLIIELKKTPDIAYNLGKIKTKNQILVGFALETNNEIENAKEKLHKKNFDLIILNSLRDKDAGFNTDTNKITIIARDGKITPYDTKPKKDVAFDIAETIKKLIVDS